MKNDKEKYIHKEYGPTTITLEIEDYLTYEMCDEINKSIDERREQLISAARVIDEKD